MPVVNRAQTRTIETIYFVVITLGIAFAFQIPNLIGGRSSHVWNSLTMITPGVIGLGMSWLFRRETPAAIGLTFTGWRPWVFAFCFPLAVEAIILVMAFFYM